MDDLPTPEPRTLHLYCRVEVLITDPQALTSRAVAELREADIDWSEEEDDLEQACAELGGSVPMSLASLADISRIIDGLPGVEARGGLCWAEPGPPREAFAPVSQA